MSRHTLLLLGAACAALLMVAPILAVVIRFAIGIRQANSARGEPRVCNSCGKSDIRPSWQAGVTDKLLIWCGHIPYRCRACNSRFYRRQRDCVNLESAQSDGQIPPTEA